VSAGSRHRWLVASDRPLVEAFDAAVLDLDGTLFRGTQVVPGAPEAVAALRRAGGRPAFVTNNASRPPGEVVEHLTAVGLRCDLSEVLTAAQAGAGLVAARVPAGSAVLVVGGAGVREALIEVGLRPVFRADHQPVAVLQGWSPELNWAGLAEGAFALEAGLPWIVTNPDATLPTDRGIAPGNGSFVAMLASVTGREPDAVAGKPMAPLIELAISRLAARDPLLVGDRLDTDIAAASAVGLPSLLVLSGVTDLRALLLAGPTMRPSFLARDVTGLLRRHRGAVAGPDAGWSCGRWSVKVASVPPSTAEAGRPPRLVLSKDGAPDQVVDASGWGDRDSDGLDAVRAAAAAAWACLDAGEAAVVDDELIAALDQASGQGPARSAEQGT